MYNNLEEFYQALHNGTLDKSKLTLHVDCGNFFVLDAQEETVVEGDERDVLQLFIKLCGVQTVYETVPDWEPEPGVILPKEGEQALLEMFAKQETYMKSQLPHRLAGKPLGCSETIELKPLERQEQQS